MLYISYIYLLKTIKKCYLNSIFFLFSQNYKTKTKLKWKFLQTKRTFLIHLFFFFAHSKYFQIVPNTSKLFSLFLHLPFLSSSVIFVFEFSCQKKIENTNEYFRILIEENRSNKKNFEKINPLKNIPNTSTFF